MIQQLSTSNKHFFFKLHLVICFLICNLIYSQQSNPSELSPGGALENVFDNYGNRYTLNDIRIQQENSNQGKFVDTSCVQVFLDCILQLVVAC